jgi:hypothetical protein
MGLEIKVQLALVAEALQASDICGNPLQVFSVFAVLAPSVLEVARQADLEAAIPTPKSFFIAEPPTHFFFEVFVLKVEVVP